MSIKVLNEFAQEPTFVEIWNKSSTENFGKEIIKLEESCATVLSFFSGVAWYWQQQQQQQQQQGAIL